MGHMQRLGTPFFEGRVGPEEADAWRQRLERNFQSIRCPMDYWVELAARDRLQMRFMDIEQGSRSVREYDAEFSRLLVHAGFGMEAEHQLTNRFLEGLRKDIRTLCRGGKHTSRASLVELAASVEADLSGLIGLVAVPSAPAIPPRSQQQQQRRGGASFSSGSGRGSLPAQGQKRSRD
ncbi:unnamed protein product [Microthlaspi erraticum]|uniref:Retrotransposon gag domain-containing protein n=1 Tax=Microthlaspi erraticum TaxID=1685480 RepID=A0A6D2KGW7_9BRAS|nr:unnamed protein product [Microthlaspi erraticum]